MAYNIQDAGVTTILDTSSTGAGSWYRVHPKMENLTIHVVQNGTSAGATASSTTVIEASNDGVNPLGTVLGTVALSSNSGTGDGFAVSAHWQYIRAKLNSIGAASAGATGTTAAVKVLVSGNWGA